jgi:hypothetical protein
MFMGRTTRQQTKILLFMGFIVAFVYYCESSLNTCKYDTDCKGDKVCRNGQCVGIYENLDISISSDINSDTNSKDTSEFQDGEVGDTMDIKVEDGEGDAGYDDTADNSDVNCPSPCEVEGKRYCRDSTGYIECKKLYTGEECPEEIFTPCEPGTECRNGLCDRDECNEGETSCTSNNTISVCQKDSNGFLKYKEMPCNIGTVCNKKLCCPVDMVEANGFCIDRYEAVVSDKPDCTGTIFGQNGDNYPSTFPDEVDIETNPPQIPLYACSIASVLPSRFITYYQARAVCLISGKRLCTEAEFISGCTGDNQNYKYPYGTDWRINMCNDYIFNIDVSQTGKYPGCKSTYGTYDMSGNVEEWIQSETNNDVYYAMGGKVGVGATNSTCQSKVSMSPTASNNLLGFRCCK